MSLVQSTNDDLLAIAKCHKECFKSSLSSRLGIPYIKKTFEWFLVNHNRFLFHIEINGVVAGYCGGFVPQYVGDGSTSGIMQYTMREAVLGILCRPWLLVHPEVINMYPLILKNLQRKIFRSANNKNNAPAVAAPDKRIGLVVIGVHPEFRGSGIFPELMQEFETRAHIYQIEKLVLSVKRSNKRAIAAYTKQGWFITREHAHTLEMCKYLQ